MPLFVCMAWFAALMGKMASALKSMKGGGAGGGGGILGGMAGKGASGATMGNIASSAGPGGSMVAGPPAGVTGQTAVPAQGAVPAQAPSAAPPPQTNVLASGTEGSKQPGQDQVMGAIKKVPWFGEIAKTQEMMSEAAKPSAAPPKTALPVQPGPNGTMSAMQSRAPLAGITSQGQSAAAPPPAAEPPPAEPPPQPKGRMAQAMEKYSDYRDFMDRMPENDDPGSRYKEAERPQVSAQAQAQPSWQDWLNKLRGMQASRPRRI